MTVWLGAAALGAFGFFHMPLRPSLSTPPLAKSGSFTATPTTSVPAYTALCYAIDGDTLRCGPGYVRRIRLLGIDAAELPGHCRKGRDCAPGDPWAHKRALAAFANQTLTIYPLKQDVYGRTVAIVRNTVGVNASCFMLQFGATYRPSYDERDLIADECRPGHGRTNVN
nr:hypothetical protein [Novosphingobium sp. SG916]